MNTPSWLGLNAERTAFIYLPGRAEIVREIFALSIGGLGGYSIAKLLNSRRIPAFGTSGRWDQSTIHNMLTNRATVGEYQKKRTQNGKEYAVGEPILGYYPAVIDERTFETAQIARRNNFSSGRGRKGRFVTNLFTGLTRCAYCNSPVKFQSNGSSKRLICAGVFAVPNCFRFAWMYRDFERSFFALLRDTNHIPKIAEIVTRLESAGMSDDNYVDENYVYEARVDIAHTLRSFVSTVSIAAAGTNPAVSKAGALIRSYHPDRSFSVTFSDGSFRTGHPISVPRSNSQVFKSEDLVNILRLSPRQATITARLAEGEVLKKVAIELSMTLATARWHLREVFRKTNTHSQAELVNLAKRVV